MIVDVWLQPWLAGRTRARTINEVAVEAPAAPLADALGNFGCHGCVPVNVGATAATRYGPGGVRHGGRDRMGHKRQARLVCSLP